MKAILLVLALCAILASAKLSTYSRNRTISRHLNRTNTSVVLPNTRWNISRPQPWNRNATYGNWRHNRTHNWLRWNKSHTHGNWSRQINKTSWNRTHRLEAKYWPSWNRSHVQRNQSHQANRTHNLPRWNRNHTHGNWSRWINRTHNLPRWNRSHTHRNQSRWANKTLWNRTHRLEIRFWPSWNRSNIPRNQSRWVNKTYSNRTHRLETRYQPSWNRSHVQRNQSRWANKTFWNRTQRLEAGNIQQCLQDSIKVIADVKDFVYAIKNGTKDMSAILLKVQVIVADIEALIKDCGSFNLMASMNVSSNFQNCFADIENLVKLGEQLITDGKNKQIAAFIKDAYAIYTLAKQAIDDCRSHKLLAAGVESSFNITKCLNSARDHLQIAKNFFQHLNTTKKNATLLIDDIAVLTKHTSVTLVDCSLEFAAQKVQSILPDKCVDDLSITSKVGIKIMGELENIVQVLQDLPALIQSIQAAKKTCPFLNELNIAQ